MVDLDTAVAGTTGHENWAGQRTVNGDLHRDAEAFTGKPSISEMSLVTGLVVVFVILFVFDFVVIVFGNP